MAATLTVLFWNVHRKDLAATIARLIVARNVDLVVLAELPGTGPETRQRLADETGEPVYYANNPEPLAGKTHLFSRYPSQFTPHRLSGRLGRLNLFEADIALFPPFLLGTVHLIDRRNHARESQEEEAREVASDLRSECERLASNRLLVCGDFNLNPFEMGMRSPRHFHAVMDRREAAKGSRTIQERTYPLLYNPMWSLLGDFPQRPPGTYYFENATHDATYWHLLDQFLLSPELLSVTTVSEVEIVTGDGLESYLTHEGRIQERCILRSPSHPPASDGNHPMSTLTFWPDDIVNNLPVSPLTVLREAATELGQVTKGAIEVEVRHNPGGSMPGEADYDFTLVSKAMNFRYALFSVSFDPVLLYPCQIYGSLPESPRVESEEELRQALVNLLGSQKAISVVKAMLAQSQ